MFAIERAQKIRKFTISSFTSTALINLHWALSNSITRYEP